MTTEYEELPPVSYQILEVISDSGINYSSLLNDKALVERYSNINILAAEIHKLIIFKIIASEKIYSLEEGNDFKLTLTPRGKSMLKSLHV
jgi:hypothetical protein